MIYQRTHPVVNNFDQTLYVVVHYNPIKPPTLKLKSLHPLVAPRPESGPIEPFNAPNLSHPIGRWGPSALPQTTTLGRGNLVLAFEVTRRRNVVGLVVLVLFQTKKNVNYCP